MRFICAICLIAILSFCFDGRCYADSDIIDDNNGGDIWNVLNDTRVMNGTVVEFDNININNSVTFENMGYIDGDIHICPECIVEIKNSGHINGSIYTSYARNLVQIISNADEVTSLNVNGHYNVSVNGEMLSLDEIINASATADKIIFSDSTLVLDSPIKTGRGIGGPVMEFLGETMIYIDDANDFTDTPVLSNVAGDGAIHFHSDNLNPLYALHSSVDDNHKLYLSIVRETDYSKVLRNKTGEFLNKLRLENPDDALLRKLDSVADMDELNRVMARSVRLKPRLLMNPIKTIDRFETSVDSGFDNKNSNFRIMAEPIIVLSDDFYSYGGRVEISGNVVDTLSVGLAAYGTVVDFADDINDYSAMLYGVNATATYNFYEKYFVRAVVGATVAEFDTGAVLDNDKAVYNPSGVDLYGAIDIASRINFGDSLSVMPFVGLVTNRISMLNDSDLDSTGRVGIGIGYGFEMLGMRYDYDAVMSVNTSGDTEAGLRISVFSVMDAAGGDIKIVAVHDENNVSYKISAGLKLEF